MKRQAFVIIAAALAFATFGAGNEPIKEEMKKFQGWWTPTYVEQDGQPIPKEGINDLRNIEILVKDDKVFLKEGGKVRPEWHITFKVDPSKSPRPIDLAIAVETFKPRTSLGIYKFEGDTLKISIIEPRKEPERATEFVTRVGSPNRLWYFKKKGPIPKGPNTQE